MESRYRELRKEVEKAKPGPFKRTRQTQILVVDEYGKVKSGNWLTPALHKGDKHSMLLLIGIEH